MSSQRALRELVELACLFGYSGSVSATISVNCPVTYGDRDILLVAVEVSHGAAGRAATQGH